MLGEHLPIGTIIIWGGDPTEIPENWKVCNGDPLATNQYQKLHHVLGKRWDNDAKYKENHFNIPDLRGVFLRGVNEDRNDEYYDPEFSERKRLKNDPTQTLADNDAGTYQKYEIQSHSHELKDIATTGVSNGAPGPDGNSYRGYGLVPATKLAGGKETRPVNAYVYFIIKVK